MYFWALEECICLTSAYFKNSCSEALDDMCKRQIQVGTNNLICTFLNQYYRVSITANWSEKGKSK